MKVLFITTSFPSVKMPSSGTFVKKLVDALVDEGDEVTVIAPAPDSNNKEMGVHLVKYAPRRYRRLAHLPGGIPEQLKKSKFNYLWLAAMLLTLAACVRWKLQQHSVVVANWSLSGLAAVIGTAFSGVPVVTVLRGSDVNQAEHGIGRFLLALCVFGSSAIVCVSKSMETTIRTRFPKLKRPVFVIENGININQIHPKSRVPTRESGYRLVFVGNLTKNKGLSTILAALKILKENGYSFTMRFIGGGDIAEYKKISESLDLGAHVDFVGAVQHDVVVDELIKSDILVNASYSEGRSNAILEAISLGIPVIASNIDANCELLRCGEFGGVFECGNEVCLASEVAKVFNDYSGASKKSRLAIEHFLKNEMSWKTCARQYRDVFFKLLA